MSASPGAVLPPAAVGAILLASLAASWHLEWMPPGTLEEALNELFRKHGKLPIARE